MSEAEYPKISIIVACLNEEYFIESCINSLLQQDYKGDFDIIISDGGSTDETLDIIKKLQRKNKKIILYNNPDKYQSFGRNLAIERSNAEFVAYLDAHRLANKFWLSELWDCYSEYSKIDDKIAGVGSVHYDALENNFSKAQEIAFRSIISGAGASNFLNMRETKKTDHSCMMLYKKDIIEKVGLYNTKLNVGEDIELNHRLTYAYGYNLYLNPKAINYYFPRRDFNALFIQQYNYGLWRQLVFKILNSFPQKERKLPALMRLKTLVPGIFVFSLILVFLLSFVNPIFFIIYSIIFILYFSIILGVSIYISINKRLNPFILLLIFITIHFAYGFGVISYFLNINKLN